jgi:hypothetical protein
VQVVGGLVTALNLVISLLVVVRLVRLGQRSGGPELWLGLYFLLATFLGTLLSSIVYVSWADARLAPPDPVIRALHAAFLLSASGGFVCLYHFTRVTFRPDSAWAGRAVAAGVAALLVSFLGMGLVEGYAVRVLNGWFYWLGWAARSAALLWMAAESLRYWGLLRRRMRLDLADPVVTERFMLWGIWAATVFLLGASDPLARLWYCALTGSTTVWVPEIGQPIIAAVIGLTSALGVVIATTLLLTFFPTPAYRRWVHARHEASARPV